MNPTSQSAALRGLVLAGGRSRRMKRDKAALPAMGGTALDAAFALVSRHADSCAVSIRADQTGDPVRAGRPQIVDTVIDAGPLGGIISALESSPGSAWLVVACDLPLLDDATLAQLLAGRETAALATAFQSAHDGLPEPLCAIYEPASLPVLQAYLHNGMKCPRKILIREADRVALLPPAGAALDNVNTPEDLRGLRVRMAQT